jgi:hypothetical protein
MIEEEHSDALSGCMEALESAILRVPVTGGARVINLQLVCFVLLLAVCTLHG